MIPFVERFETVRLGWASNPANQFDTTRLLMTDSEHKDFPLPISDDKLIRCYFIVKNEQIVAMKYPNILNAEALNVAKQELIDNKDPEKEFYICYRINSVLVCPTRIDGSRADELTGDCYASYIDWHKSSLH